MPILLNLFLTFLKIGAISFGGGYGMISLIREEVLKNSWLTEEELLNFIAVAESTPGPIAINMATFIGSSQAGFVGSLLATLGVVLPSFVIILIIASLIKNLIKYNPVQATLSGIKASIVGLIAGTAFTMFLSTIFNIVDINSTFSFDWKALIIFVVLATVAIIFKKVRGKQISPILLILLSGVLGITCYIW